MKEKIYFNVFIDKSPIQGLGVFSKCDFEEGNLIYEVTGKEVQEVYSEQNASLHPGWVGVKWQVWIEPEDSNPMVYQNHSCQPNALLINKQVICYKKIYKNQEILIDYSTTEFDPFWHMECYCKSKTCRRTILSYSNLTEQVRQEIELFKDLYQKHF